MAYKSNGSNLANIVYGFGTATTYGNFSTSVMNSHFKTGGTAMRFVPKNANFMPFSDMDVGGYQAGDSDILRASVFAGVNRFIMSGASDKVTRTDSSVTAIYYKGNGYNGRGELYIGGTSSGYRVSSDCPPVILIAIQGAGGSGSSGLARGNGYIVGIQVWQHVGGNGGGSGGTAFFQLRMPHDATTPTLVGYFQVSSSGTSLRDKRNVLFATASAGGTGGSVSGTPDLWDGQYSHNQGNGGSGGGVTVYSLSSRPEWKNVTFTTSTGSTISTISGATGGKGGYNYSSITTSVSDRYASSSGGSKSSTSVYINNANSGNTIVGKSGGSGGSNSNNGTTGYTGAGGGGGAGSMFGVGGAGNSSPGSTAYGAGGGGGTPTKTSWSILTGDNAWVSGKSGAGGCVKFFW